MSFQHQTEAFTGWLASNDVHLSSKVQITDLRSKNMGRGIVATEDIEADEELFTIPRSIIINVENCGLIRDYPDLSKKFVDLNHWESLIIILMYEIKAKGSSSFWAPYFNILPINDEENYTFNQLVFWNDEELSHLKPSLILERIGKDMSEVMFSKLYPIIVEEMELSMLKNITIDDYNKVASIIMSYSFDVDNGADEEDEEDEDEEDENEDESSKSNKGNFKSMVPLADTLNADTNLNNSKLIYKDSSLVMRSIKKISKGEQIFNTYSDHPNSEILRRYGYVEKDGSKYDFGEVPLSVIKTYFMKQSNLSESDLDDIFLFLTEILSEENEDDEVIEIILDSYDCFSTNEVILELIFLIQVLTILISIHRISSINLMTKNAKFQLVNRIFKKCYQLIESKRLTKVFLTNFEKILNTRLAEYPNIETPEGNDRRFLADVVVKSEYQSLKNCLDLEKTFSEYKFVDDEKLLKNIIKKRFSEDNSSEEDVKRTKR